MAEKIWTFSAEFSARGVAEFYYPDVYVFGEGPFLHLVGENPAGSLYRHIRQLTPPSVSVSPEYIKYVMCGSLADAMAHQIFIRPDGGEWRCVKNRFAFPDEAPLPFRSLEEAAIVSAARGWPDPVELGGFLSRVSRAI